MSQPTSPENFPGHDGTIRPSAMPPVTATPPLSTTSWSFDFWRMLGYSAFSAAVWSGVLWLATNGGVSNSYGTKTATASSMFAGIAAAVMSMMLAVLMHSSSRRDEGFRRDGLVPLLVFGSLSAPIVQLLVMLTWPLFLSDALTPGTVAAEFGLDGASTIVAGVFVVAANAAFLALFVLVKLGFEVLPRRWGMPATFVVLIPALGAVFFYGLQGGVIFDRPASETSIALWVVLGVVAFGALVVAGIGLSRSGRPERREKPLSA